MSWTSTTQHSGRIIWPPEVKSLFTWQFVYVYSQPVFSADAHIYSEYPQCATKTEGNDMHSPNSQWTIEKYRKNELLIWKCGHQNHYLIDTLSCVFKHCTALMLQLNQYHIIANCMLRSILKMTPTSNTNPDPGPLSMNKGISLGSDCNYGNMQTVWRACVHPNGASVKTFDPGPICSMMTFCWPYLGFVATWLGFVVLTLPIANTSKCIKTHVYYIYKYKYILYILL